MSDLISRQAANEQKTEESLLKSDPDSVSNEDVVYRQAAIDAAIEAADDWDGGCSKERERFIRDALEELPPAQLDMSGYSDKLWKAAYERGKRDAQAEIIRCDECRYYSRKTHRCEPLGMITCDGFWCKQAERKTG